MRGFQSFLRGFSEFFRGFQRSSQRPSQRQISSQRLSVLLPLIVLPLELSSRLILDCWQTSHSLLPARLRRCVVEFLFGKISRTWDFWGVCGPAIATQIGAIRSRESIRANRFAEKKITFSQRASASRESPQTCGSQCLATRSAIRKKGVRFGNPEPPEGPTIKNI